MQLAFIQLTSYQEEITTLWVEAASIKHIGVSLGATFVETSGGCSYVKESPDEVLEKINKALEYFE